MWLVRALSILTAFASSPGDEDVYETWRDYLAPKAAECAFEESGWLGTFWSAVSKAQEDRKPILLWAMNGHPMACT